MFLFLLAVVMSSTGIFAFLREQKVLKVQIGMSRIEVEKLVGNPRGDDEDCAYITCPENAQSNPENARSNWYHANASLWYGRLEDKLLICYDNDIVCELRRIGL